MLFLLAAMIIAPMNPQTGYFWKVMNTSCDVEETGKVFFQYFTERAYNANDVFLSTSISSQAKPYYSYGCSGLIFRFINHLVIFSGYDDHDNDIPVLDLNPDMKYITYIMDQKLEFVSAFPDLFPRTMIELGQNIGTKNGFLKVVIVVRTLML